MPPGRANPSPGSPPRAWGRLVERDVRYLSVRFTPTRVGTTPTLNGATLDTDGSPPHAWGRRLQQQAGPNHFLGSPPRAWGRRALVTASIALWSGSPPRAWGRLSRWPSAQAPRAVHPHARGDDARSSQNVGSGSPPRAWGRLPLTIPLLDYSTVHPHARGDDCSSESIVPSVTGSPPRAWGRRPRPTTGPTCADGFTPTCVGTTWAWPSSRRRLSVHPHARGDVCSMAVP